MENLKSPNLAPEKLENSKGNPKRGEKAWLTLRDGSVIARVVDFVPPHAEGCLRLTYSLQCT